MIDESSMLQAECRNMKYEIIEKNENGAIRRLELKGKHNNPLGYEEDESSLDVVWRMKSLQCLSIRFLPHRDIPLGIGALRSTLTELCISGCKRLTELPKEIGLLRNLKTLTIRNCAVLRTLPPEIGQLKHLQSLNVLFCNNLWLPAGLGDLQGLRELHVAGVNNIPNELSNLQSLRTLRLRRWPSATHFPDWIGQLTNLQALYIVSWPNICTLPESIRQLQRLETFEIDGCQSLRTIPRSIWDLENLKLLRLCDCPMLSILSQHPTTTDSDRTRQSSYGSHNGTPRILGAVNLQTLTLHSLAVRALPEELGTLEKLTSLKLICCHSLETLPPAIGRLTNLTLLEVSVCPSLTKLSDNLKNLVNLRQLTLNMAHDLKSINQLPVNLESLKLKNLPSIESLPTQIGELARLSSLIIGDCRNLKELPATIGDLTALRYLDVSYCCSLEHLPGAVARLTRLHTLRIGNCGKMRSIPKSFAALTSLVELKLSRCANLKSLPAGLDRLPTLEKLDLSHSHPDSVFQLFQGKWDETSPLKELSLEGCSIGNEFFEILPNLPKGLISLDLDDTGITNLDGFIYGPGLPRGIVDLDLSNGPFLDSNSKYHQSCLERVLKRYPCLEYIGTNDDESSFSLDTYFMLRFNEAGRVLLSDDLRPSIPISVWPLVMERVQKVVQHVGRNDSKRMEASILFEFLQGPVTLNQR